VGYYVAPDFAEHGFMSYQGQGFDSIEIPLAGATGTWPLSINNKREIVGVYADATAFRRGFILREGSFATFILPHTQFNSIEWITDKGQLSGSYVDEDGKPHAYIAKRIEGSR